MSAMAAVRDSSRGPEAGDFENPLRAPARSALKKSFHGTSELRLRD